jgi:single-strand DNA-binding protein
MNLTVLLGRLTKDPELSYTPNTQTAVVKFTIAVDRPRRNGEDQGADFLRVTAFGSTAENLNRYKKKGDQVLVRGRIQTGSYKNRDGVTVYTTDIMAESIEYVGGSQGRVGSETRDQGPAQQRNANAGSQNRSNGRPQQRNDSFDEGFGEYDDDIPDSFEAADDDIPF